MDKTIHDKRHRHGYKEIVKNGRLSPLSPFEHCPGNVQQGGDKRPRSRGNGSGHAHQHNACQPDANERANPEHPDPVRAKQVKKSVKDKKTQWFPVPYIDKGKITMQQSAACKQVKPLISADKWITQGNKPRDNGEKKQRYNIFFSCIFRDK
ncbi:hypothetical protein [Komagataeibacter sp. FNDCR2]|uniref:hypothetical protein n=1 Tax=Komagataeibacter sp. FNDCR2 TaxID=2878682 RepID=UPI001E2E05C6|nr:hypothetical protein [Komagataeibacter sp. FNDCR2]MCE2574779.1 hypothetical protein [Komagataeibacter sp. FNDCR2]